MGDRTSEINPNHCKLIIEQHLPALIATVQKNSKRLKPLCSAMSELGHIELSPVQLTQGGQGVNSLLDLGLILGFTELSDVGSVPLNSYTTVHWKKVRSCCTQMMPSCFSSNSLESHGPGSLLFQSIVPTGAGVLYIAQIAAVHSR